MFKILEVGRKEIVRFSSRSRNDGRNGDLKTSRQDVKPVKILNFLKKGKMVISVKIQNFSRSRMTKRTSPLESSPEI